MFEISWRRRPESNRGSRICNPVRHHSAMVPSKARAFIKSDERGAMGNVCVCHDFEVST